MCEGFSQWEISLFLTPIPMNGSHPSCQPWEETIGNLMEQSTSVRKTQTFGHNYIYFKHLGHYRYGCNGCWAMIYGIVSMEFCNKYYAHTWKSQMYKIPQSTYFQLGLFLMLNFLAGTETA